MVIAPSLGWQQVKVLFRSSLYANSVSLIAANVVNAAFGFFFWTVAARLYRAEDVGLAAASVSVISLVVMLSGLGLDYSMVRFLPRAPDPHSIVNSSLTIGAAAALVLSGAFTVGLDLWSPALVPLRHSVLFVVGLATAAMCTTVSSLVNSVFLTRKRAGFVLAQSAVFGATKILAVIALASVASAAALVGSWALGTVVAVACGVLWLLPRVEGRTYRLRPMVNREAVRTMTRFAFANYVTTVLWSAPMYLLPLLVVNLIGLEANAYFYVASSVSGLLAMIPTAVAMSLFAHGSHEQHRMLQHTFESVRFALWLLVPAIGGVFLFGGNILLLFGRAYSDQATRLLWMLALSTLPMTVNFFFFSVRRVQQRMGVVIVCALWILSITLGLSAVLLPWTGLIGVGVAWFVAQCSVALAILVWYAVSRRGSH